jgi:hypothetical protein
MFAAKTQRQALAEPRGAHFESDGRVGDDEVQVGAALGACGDGARSCAGRADARSSEWADCARRQRLGARH